MANRLTERGVANEMKLRHDNFGNYRDFNGHREYLIDRAITTGVTSTTFNASTAPAGSVVRTTHATGLGATFIATGGVLVVNGGAPVMPEVIEAVAPLTDNSGGTPAETLADQNNAVAGVDGTGNNAASKADVDARLVTIAHNVASVNAKVEALITALTDAGWMAE